MSNVTINVKNDAMLGRTNDKALHITLIEQQQEIERLNKMLEETIKEYEHKQYITGLITENGIICQKNKEIEKLTKTLEKIRTIINNEKITGIEAKLMIKDILEEK